MFLVLRFTQPASCRPRSSEELPVRLRSHEAVANPMKLYACVLVLGLLTLAFAQSAIAPTAAAQADEEAMVQAATVTSVDARGVVRVNGRASLRSA